MNISMKFRGLIIPVVILFILAVQTFANIKVAYPPDNIIVNLPEIALVGTSDESGNVTVKVDGGVSLSGQSVPIEFGGFIVKLKLKSGSNTITLKSPSGKSQTTTIAYKSKPSGFKSWIVHEYQQNFAECKDCHRVNDKRNNYKRMAMGTQSCRTAACHGDVGTESKYVHGPAAGGVCISCHNPHGSFNEAIIQRTGADQCFVCHEDKESEFDQSHQHSPVKNGDCTGCHDPHQSDHKFQLRGEGQTLCFNCHDAEKKTGDEYLHGPVKSGECNACHNPHASPYSYQLMAEGNAVCFACHEEKSNEMKQRHVHPPVAESCVNCHDPHTSPEKMQLVANPPELCWSCHVEMGQVVSNSTVPHPPVAKGQCSQCHDSHASNKVRLLKDDLVPMCGSCHLDMGEKLAEEPNRHGPVIDDDCGACHALHGANFPTLLVEYFPPEFYNGYREDLYTLCFRCHNSDIARDAETTTLTDFRDGSRNLHYLHINRRKGRSCKACHDIHASDQEKHIRRSVPFGGMYEYPIQFTKTKNGGGCVVGCHKPRSYSRSSRNSKR